MQGSKGTTEVMEIPATAAAPADLLLTNTLPGTWISSCSLQLSWARRREKDRGGKSKKNIVCRKSKSVWRHVPLYPKFQGRPYLFIVMWMKRLQGQIIYNKQLSPLRETLKRGITWVELKLNMNERPWSHFLIDLTYSLWLHVLCPHSFSSFESQDTSLTRIFCVYCCYWKMFLLFLSFLFLFTNHHHHHVVPRWVNVK